MADVIAIRGYNYLRLIAILICQAYFLKVLD
jgi:hypothetical protein